MYRTILDMRTMSWQGLGHSRGKISLKVLLEGGRVDFYDDTTDLEIIIEEMITGGFPGSIDKSISQATDINRAYIDLLAETDISHYYRYRNKQHAD